MYIYEHTKKIFYEGNNAFITMCMTHKYTAGEREEKNV